MAKVNKPTKAQMAAANRLWKDVDIAKDFDEMEDVIESEEVGEYNLPKMILYSANVNYARQLVRLSDSLKPVERRILYTMYRQGLRPGTKKKSISITGAVTEIHPHGGASVYDTLIGMAQYWKKQLPMIRVFGSYGTEVNSIYAADRYTEACLTQYAWDCFFKDYDDDCVQSIFSTTGNRFEPVSLPSRYPNVLINGGMGIAVGNAFKIPPYNIEEIIKVVKERLYTNSKEPIYLAPDFPTGCDIIDTDNAIKRICETGRGNLKMRARTEIIDEGKHWCIRCTNLPWGVNQESIVASIVKYTKAGILPIKDVQDRSQPIVLDDGSVITHVDLNILVDKAHDPYAVREKLFKRTELESTAAIDFKVVLEDLKLDELSLSGLVTHWIEERREYKRRLLNKRISRTTARIELLKILIELCSGKNLDKTVNIIKSSRESDIGRNLMAEYGMSSYQAEQIAGMRMGAFNKDALERYKKEVVEQKDNLKHLYKMVQSEKDIDDIIAAELDELKKYVVPRRSQLINPESGQSMDTTTEYFLISTKKGGLKKVSVEAVKHSKKGFGSFESMDYPTSVIRVNNMDSVLFIDSFGKFSLIKAGDIDTMTPGDYPAKAYNFTKLEGEIITMQYFQTSKELKWLKKNNYGDLYIVTLSKDGYGKKFPAKELAELTDDGRKTVRNMRLTKLRSHDFLADANYYVDNANLILYTRKGEFNYVGVNDMPNFGRDAVGNMMVRIKDGEDSCVGMCAANPDAEYVVIVTNKGLMKKCELAYIGVPSASKDTTYLATLDPNDSIFAVDTPKKGFEVCTKLTHYDVTLDMIKTLGRKAKPAKCISIQPGDNIIRIITH